MSLSISGYFLYASVFLQVVNLESSACSINLNIKASFRFEMEGASIENELIDITGFDGNIKVVLTPFPINISECIDWAKHPSVGAISTFIGTTRDNFNGQEVLSLEYSCYPSMALSEMRKLCIEALVKFSSKASPSGCCSGSKDKHDDTLLDNTVKKVLVVHRLGSVAVSDVSILIAVSTPHRELGLKACQFLIDSIKKSVPIWKKELLGNGKAVWK